MRGMISCVFSYPQVAAHDREGEHCQNYLFVLTGCIRVTKFADNGREIVLYRVGSGETCILTTSCLLADDRYPAGGITETDVHAFTISASVFHEAVALSDSFRAFVFASFGERLTDLIALVEAVALRRADERLAQRLLELCDTSGVITMTHHALASELGTTREVVSRLLKEFERQAFVQLRRNRIEIRNRSALEKLMATDRNEKRAGYFSHERTMATVHRGRCLSCERSPRLVW